PAASPRPVRGASAGSCRLYGRRPVRVLRRWRGEARPSSLPLAVDRGRPRRRRRSRRRQGKPLQALVSSWGAPLFLVGYFGGVECRRKPLLFAVISRALPESRPADPGRVMPADDLAVRVLAHQVVQEQ